MFRPLLMLILGFSSFAPFEVKAQDAEEETIACAEDMLLPADAWLDTISTGWRLLRDGEQGQYGPTNERENARVVYYAFREAGYPAAIAFAAIVNAYSESALDNRARMDQVFYYNHLYYPNGTGAIGLFQLLPSTGGAGGPAGPEQGLSRVFQGGRWAGTPWQAHHYGTTPDANGRMYYDGSDPLLNTQRIILEVERDGTALMNAYDAGASIAHLSYVFGRDIERPQVSTWYRRRLAVEMLGAEVALMRHPERYFAEGSFERVFSDPYAVDCAPNGEISISKMIPLPPVEPPVRASVAWGSFAGLLGLLLFGLSRRP